MKIGGKRHRGILVAGIEVESILLRLFCNHLFRIEAHFQDRRKEEKKKHLQKSSNSLSTYLNCHCYFCRNRTQTNAITVLWVPNRGNSELISVALVSVNIYSRHTDYSLNYHIFSPPLGVRMCIIVVASTLSFLFFPEVYQ